MIKLLIVASLITLGWMPDEPLCIIPDRDFTVSEIVEFSPETDAAERASIENTILWSSYDFDPLMIDLGHPIYVSVSGWDNDVTVDKYYEWPQGIRIRIADGDPDPLTFMHEIGHIHDAVLKYDQGDWDTWRSLDLPWEERPREIYAEKFTRMYSPLGFYSPSWEWQWECAL